MIPFYRVLRRFLFLFPPETIHEVVFTLLRMPPVSSLLAQLSRFEHPALQREVFGLTFRNPVGLAAGMDKNAEVFEAMGALGFGFVEVGTVTPRPQKGNPRPRLFRLVEDQALINRMGFNNDGVEAVRRRLEKRKDPTLLIGGNIGKNKDTPNEKAKEDYEFCFRELYEVVDFFVVNVSSPNTPNLRQLQEKEPLRQLLLHLQAVNAQMPRRKPLLLKIAPDLNDSQLDDVVEIVQETGVDGVIATNTTIAREGLRTSPRRLEKIGAGGLSGKPLARRSTEVIRYLHQRSGGTFPIIGVGGIHSAEDALEKLAAGASLIELFTGFIYEGPGLIKQIKQALVHRAQTER